MAIVALECMADALVSSGMMFQIARDRRVTDVQFQQGFRGVRVHLQHLKRVMVNVSHW